MSLPSTATGEQLANALQALGVKFILGGESKDDSLHQEPAQLIAALAQSPEARLRLALIPLFLEHPQFAAHVRPVAQNLNAPARLILQCYYSAAVCLQQKYHLRLNKLQQSKPPLPDHFSAELQLKFTTNPAENLRVLAVRQQTLSGAYINWLGTYEHAAQRFMLHLERGK